MRTYVDTWQSSEGLGLMDIIDLMGKAGLRVIAGSHDFYFDWEDEAEFKARMSQVHRALAGSGVLYKTHTINNLEAREESVLEANWVLPRL
jgi:hypothetical protein